MTEWQLRTGSAADLDLVGPLWVAVHHRHVETMPQLAPYVSDDETWRVRRGLYEDLLAKPDTLLLLAFVGEAAVGYGLAHVCRWTTAGSRTPGQLGRGSARSNRSVCYRNTVVTGWAPNCSIDSSGTCMTSASRIWSWVRFPVTPTPSASTNGAAIDPTWLYLSRSRGAELR